MRGILLTGSHPRHLYLAEQLHKNRLLKGLVVERREEFVPSPPPGLALIDEANFIRHFRDREVSEHRFFGTAGQYCFDGLDVCEVTVEELNGPELKTWISEREPDFVISYGVHKLSQEMIDSFPPIAWNVHGGLSPWYRGTITLFWPFYFLKPNWAGMTIHRLSSKLDGGDIVHHSVPRLERGDGIHDTACRAVQQVAEDLVKILRLVEGGAQIAEVPQRSGGKLFLSKDWKPEHLRVIYNLFDNDIVDQYLDGKLGHDEPPLVRAF
jgi:hypothetical protein